MPSGRTKLPQRKNRRGAYFNCETCNEEFYAQPSYIRKSERRGFRIRYCSMACYDKTGNKNPFWGQHHAATSVDKMRAHPNRPKFGPGISNPNFTRFGVEYGFRGSRSRWWRMFLLDSVGKCERCGIDDKRILNLHHIDRNRGNNIRENLLLLCWNCHAVDHYEAKDGYYHFFNQCRPEK